jgi:GNAT superfamily N-acetyltransferase
MEIEIRAIALEDARSAAKLSAELGYPCSVETMTQRILQLESLKDREHAWVATLGGGVIGWIQVSRIMRIESGEFAEITGLVVDARARGAGVGKGLITHVQAWAQTQAFARIVVRMNIKRTESRGFYEKVGFREEKQQLVYEWKPA